MQTSCKHEARLMGFRSSRRCHYRVVPRYFGDWLQADTPFHDCPDLTCFTEIPGGRALLEEALTAAITDHLIGVGLLERLTTAGAWTAAAQRVPKSARERSGDFGEILASCWVEE